ncbi:DNA excision repair protein ERCC-1 [Candida viswanathii]|uniref:DNA excision repair protein ERCC-1 n=1 Tax=Candida viswanathii TaxID=5486 RepID=A0A367Y7B9_9ASCO|nr:DNA excision repair protein ERCC-1 [Candida viswanathii]
MSSDNNKSNEVDQFSFQSIAAGVQRMRDEARGVAPTTTTSEVQQAPPEPSSSRVTEPQPQQPTPVQPAKEIVTKTNTYQRATLDPLTARPVRPFERLAVQRAGTPRSGGQGPSEILIARSQEGNPVYQLLATKRVRCRIDPTILSDYYISPTLQFLFLSLLYHGLHPEYIAERWKRLNKGSTIDRSRSNKVLRVLLVRVDVNSPEDYLRNLLVFCMKVGLAMVLAWSAEDAVEYIMLAKQIDDNPTKSLKSIEGNKATDYNTCIVESLTSIQLIQKPDVNNLLANCKSLKQIVLQSCRGNNTSGQGLSNISGLGSKKLANLKEAFQQPFIANKDYDK